MVNALISMFDVHVVEIGAADWIVARWLYPGIFRFAMCDKSALQKSSNRAKTASRINSKKAPRLAQPASNLPGG